jgi:hypothetical protein
MVCVYRAIARRLALTSDRGVPTSMPVNSYAISAEQSVTEASFLRVLHFPLAVLIPHNDLFLNYPGSNAMVHSRCKYQGA